MPITVSCSECGTTLKAPDNAAGRKVKCPKCSAVIAVPAEAAEQISSEPPARTRPAPPPPARSSRDDDRGPRRSDRDDDDRGPRRSDRDDDYDDDPRPRRDIRQGDGAQGTGVQLGLGIAGLCCGIIGAAFSWIPFCGAVVAWPMCGLGLALGGTGLIIAIVKKAGYGFPIAGTAVSVAGLALSLYWYFWVVATANQIVNDANKQLQNLKNVNPGANINPGGGNNPVLQGGAINLVGGKATYDADLTVGDAKDKIRNNFCKVFTMTMTEGRTYQIDMMSGIIDSYLRLEDPAGKEVAQDDDGGNFHDARIVYTCKTTGQQRIIATTFIGGTGRFTLKVEER